MTVSYHPLLNICRFDLIFLMLDPQDETYDRRLANHLVSLYYKTPQDAVVEDLVSESISPREFGLFHDCVYGISV